MERRDFLKLAGVSALGSPAGPGAAHGRPDTEYVRSHVPLARRIPAFTPTRANPALDDRPRLMSLANDYMEAENFRLAHEYGCSFQAYALRFWQYVDMFGIWHGLPVHGEYGKDNPRFGVINLPNPAWTGAAHRNGVKRLGCWFWPRPEDFDVVVERDSDGSFPVGEFGGYFINQEGDIAPDPAARLHEMFVYMRANAPERFHIQWYDPLTVDDTVTFENQRVCSSIFLNYWWSAAMIQSSHDYAMSLGLDPYDIVHAGTEAGQNNFSRNRPRRAPGGHPRRPDTTG